MYVSMFTCIDQTIKVSILTMSIFTCVGQILTISNRYGQNRYLFLHASIKLHM